MSPGDLICRQCGQPRSAHERADGVRMRHWFIAKLPDCPDCGPQTARGDRPDVVYVEDARGFVGGLVCHKCGACTPDRIGRDLDALTAALVEQGWIPREGPRDVRP